MWIPYPNDSSMIFKDEDENWFVMVRRIFRDHGWPNIFQSAECMRVTDATPHPQDVPSHDSDDDDDDKEMEADENDDSD
nr:hypothetical protein CFP56_01367 [Quercus suber]